MPGIKLSGQLCWSCGRACGGCSWSAAGIPVKGWTAEYVKRRDYETYAISDCPLYISDSEADITRWEPAEEYEKKRLAELRAVYKDTRIATGLIARGAPPKDETGRGAGGICELKSVKRKENNSMAKRTTKLTEAEKENIRELHRSGMTQKEISDRTGLGKTTVYRVCRQMREDADASEKGAAPEKTETDAPIGTVGELIEKLKECRTDNPMFISVNGTSFPVMRIYEVRNITGSVGSEGVYAEIEY